MATRVFHDKDTALDTLTREELGIDREQLGGPACIAAGTSFVLFAVGAVVPVILFLFLNGTSAAFVSLALSTLALFLIGAGITLLTGRNIFYSGLRQVIFGLAAAGLTFGVGHLIGVSLIG